MSSDPLKEKLRNLLLVFLLLVVALASAFQEGYISIDINGIWHKPASTGSIFWVALAGGSLMAFWLALSISTRRLVSLIVAIILVEYCSQTLGIKLNLWEYKVSNESYVFPILIWVVSGLFAYTGAWKAVVRLSMKSVRLLPRALNPLILIALFSVVWFMGPPAIKETGSVALWFHPRHLFWLFFAVLLLIGSVASLRADFRVVMGVVISAWIVGFISESAGAEAGLWTFPPSLPSSSPPVYLVIGCWPLEILAQFALSALFAGEPLIPLPPGSHEREGPEGSQASTDPCFREVSEGEGVAEEGSGAETASSESAGEPAQPNEPENQSGDEPPPPYVPRAEHSVKAVDVTDDERALKVFLQISALVYLVVGFVFLLKPEFVVALLNDIGTLGTRVIFTEVAQDLAHVADRLKMPPDIQSRFWVTMTFSMMMTISFLAYFAQRDIRKNKLYVVPLMLAKAASSSSALIYFIFVQNYSPFLAIFVVDGVLFWLTLYFFLCACSAFFDAQTAYFRKRQQTHYILPDKRTTVASFKGDDKRKLLDKVLEATGFFGVLQRRFLEAKEEKGGTQSAFAEHDFSIAIKPNFAFMHAKEDCSTYTDPELVEYLIDRLCEKGFTNIKIVESQNTLGNHYAKRDVANMARIIGYNGITKEGKNRYKIHDLTLEKVRHNYPGRLGRHWAGRTWKEAHFRISFAKNKTHVFCGYTLTLKNVYGTLPLQDKLKYYHTEREYEWPTIESMKPDGGFPVHFALIDAYISADGQFGVMVDPEPNLTKTIIGGENLMAVDWVGCNKMGMDPEDPRIGRFYQLAVKTFGRPEINWVGDTSVYDPWENVSQIIIQALDIIEEDYHFADWGFSIVSACSPAFPFKGGTPSARFLRWFIRPFKSMYYKYDAL
jgi:uncharacterized protein (DUF362 family)